MEKLSTNEKYNVDNLSKELGFSTAMRNNIRNNFGDPISIRELKQITANQFLHARIWVERDGINCKRLCLGLNFLNIRLHLFVNKALNA